MEDKRQRLLEELTVVETLVRENPCRMKQGLMSALVEVVHSFIGRQCIEGASKDQVAIYLHRDVRTITRWAKQYDDFPSGGHRGHHDIEYNWMEVISWKLKHKELFKE